MTESRLLNADPASLFKIDTRQARWEPGEQPGLEVMSLDAFEDGFATQLVRLAPDAAWTPGPSEVLVLAGAVHDGTRPYGRGGYFLTPGQGALRLAAPEGARLYVKRRPAVRLALALDTGAAPWVPGLTPGLSHKPLYRRPGEAEAAAIVRWAPGTRVRRHDHPGGEEVLVLEGVFSDEHGDYPAGTWYRSPDMGEHGPFTRDGCVILARTGFLPGAIAAPDPAGTEELAETERRYVFERPFPCDLEALAARLAALDMPGWRGLSVTVEELYLAFDRGARTLRPQEREALSRIVRQAGSGRF